MSSTSPFPFSNLESVSIHHSNLSDHRIPSSEKNSNSSSSSTLVTDYHSLPHHHPNILNPFSFSSPSLSHPNDAIPSLYLNESHISKSSSASKFKPSSAVSSPNIIPSDSSFSIPSSSLPSYSSSSHSFKTNELFTSSTSGLSKNRTLIKEGSCTHLNAALDSKFPSPLLNCHPSSSSLTPTLLPTKTQPHSFYSSAHNALPAEPTINRSASLPHSNFSNHQLPNSDYFQQSSANNFPGYPKHLPHNQTEFPQRNSESSIPKLLLWHTQKVHQNDRPIVVLWDTFSQGSYPQDLLLRLHQKFLQTWSSTSENVSFSIVCTSPRYIKECFPLPSFLIRWIEASDVAMVTEVLRLSVAGLQHLTVISENPCLISALKHLAEKGRMHVDWISLSQPCAQPLPFVTFVPMDQYLKPFPLVHQKRSVDMNHLRAIPTPLPYSHEGRMKLLSKMVPIAPPPSTNHISLAWVSFGPLYHALQHPSIRERLGSQYDLPIDLSLLGGILKTAMEPFASLKFYLQAAQELGLVKLLHHGSRCLLKVSNPERLQLWANTNANSTLISSNLSPSAGTGGHMNTTTFPTSTSFSTSSFSSSSSVPAARLPQRSLTERELAPFLPLLHAFCLARMRYPPPIRTPAIGPLLKPLFAQNQLPWKKLSEYLAEAERQGVVRLNKLGVNGDVQIWICEHVCGEVWQRLKQRHGPFREMTHDLASAHTDALTATFGETKQQPVGHGSMLPTTFSVDGYHGTVSERAPCSAPLSATNNDILTRPALSSNTMATSNNHPDPAVINNIAKLWDETLSFSSKDTPSSLKQFQEKKNPSAHVSSLVFPFSSTPWGFGKFFPSFDPPSTSEKGSSQPLNVSNKSPLPEHLSKAQPQENVYYTPWNTPSFLPLECGKSSAL